MDKTIEPRGLPAGVLMATGSKESVPREILLLVAGLLGPAVATCLGQTAEVTHNVNLRSDPSTLNGLTCACSSFACAPLSRKP